MSDLLKKWYDINYCTRCDLHKTRHNVVKGNGKADAKILVIGEAPGESEDLLNEPFVGLSGNLLKTMFKMAGIQIADCYITNTVLCRPVDEITGRNRQPKNIEILQCSKNIQLIILSLQFEYVILVGEIPKKYFIKQFPYAVCIQHPAYLLRTGGIKSPYLVKNINLLKDLKSQIEIDENLQAKAKEKIYE